MARVFAHRGFSAKYPENTMAAFEKALALGADGAEFDVQLTSDGVPVIIHDESLLRTAGEDVLVRDLTLKELLKRDVSYKFRGAQPKAAVPTLEEYLDFVKDTDFISNIELKTGIFEYPGIEERVVGMIRKRRLEDRVILSSFNHYSLVRAKALAPDIRCGILYECRIAEPQDYLKRLGMDFLHPHEIFLNDEELIKYARAGVMASPWTVDDPARMRYFLQKENIYAIMSNTPDVLLSEKRALEA